MRDDSQERTEQPTPKKLKESAARGLVARSKDFNTLMLLMSVGLAFVFFGKMIVGNFAQVFTHCFSIEGQEWLSDNGVKTIFKQAMFLGFKILIPILIFAIGACLLSVILVGGWSFAPQNIAPKFQRLSPIAGFFRIFSQKSLMELIKSVLKIILIISVAIFAFMLCYKKLLFTSALALPLAIKVSTDIILQTFFLVSGALIIICAIDVPYQIWDYKQQLLMTKQEIRDEYREAEGRPEVKSKINKMQRELSKRRMMSVIPVADVIITNPTHFAVALKYDEAKMRAPKVIAKGADLVAHNIVAIAKKHNVPLVSMPPLARSIYFHTELDQEIPAALYVAVARVLAYVYQLKQYQKGKRKKPQLPEKIEIPPELIK